MIPLKISATRQRIMAISHVTSRFEENKQMKSPCFYSSQIKYYFHSSNHHALFIIRWVEYVYKIIIVNISLDASVMNPYELLSGISLRGDAQRSGFIQKLWRADIEV